MLFVYAAALILRTERKFLGSLILGLSTGILVQLHYPNLLFIPLRISIYYFVLQGQGKSDSMGKVCRRVDHYISFCSCLHFLCMNPLMVLRIPEVLFLNLYIPTLAPIRKGQILANFIDYAGRVTGKTLPFSLGLPLGAGIIIFFTMLWFIVSKNDLSFLLLIWIVGEWERCLCIGGCV